MSLTDRIKNCNRCPLRQELPEICSPIPGIYNRENLCLFIGDYLDSDSFYGNTPITGIKEKILTRLCNDLGIKSWSFTNKVKCFSEYPDNRSKTCYDWIAEEIIEVNPPKILILGINAAKHLCKGPRMYKTGTLHNKDYMIIPSITYIEGLGKKKYNSLIKRIKETSEL